MAKKKLFHITDAKLFSTLEVHDDTFSVLPFALGLGNNLKILEESISATEYQKDSFYTHLIQGIDWLVGVQRVDVLNLSLGLKKGTFVETDPIHIATRVSYEKKTIVVTATGNRGPKIDSLQGAARAPWVISVGATDDKKQLLNISARGVPNCSGPTLVTNGVPVYEELDDSKPKFLPSTSLACARMSVIAAFTKMMVRHLTSYIKAVNEGTIGTKSPPIYFLKIGFADSGVAENFKDFIHPKVKSFVEQGERGFCADHCQHTVHCVNEVISFLYEKSQQIRLIVEPDTIRRFLVAMCEKLNTYGIHEVGAGYLDAEIAVNYWSTFTPQKLLEMQFPKLSEDITAYFPSEKYFFSKELVEYLFDISSRGITAHAKVI